MKVGVILNLILFELTRRPHWRNIDKIIKINNEHDVRSTFFWLVNKGKGTLNVQNARQFYEIPLNCMQLGGIW